jgi:thiol-disulfide isomerase/thioredoxin
MMLIACAPASPPPVALPDAAVVSQEDSVPVALPEGPLAPAIHNEVWLNSDPLADADLRGKVVILDFWTFGCINCVRTIPALREMYDTYKDDPGVVLIGMHTPEFSYEKDVAAVQDAIKRLEVPYAVAIDNDMATWRAFNNRYWPSIYIIDKRGVIRYNHIGELHTDRPIYGELLALIDQLKREPGG